MPETHSVMHSCVDVLLQTRQRAISTDMGLLSNVGCLSYRGGNKPNFLACVTMDYSRS